MMVWIASALLASFDAHERATLFQAFRCARAVSRELARLGFGDKRDRRSARIELAQWLRMAPINDVGMEASFAH